MSLPDHPVTFLEPDPAGVGAFWRWAYSDILSNRNRSVFAEYIVGLALEAVSRPRIEWDAADLIFQGFGIEVKASAYLQSWHQAKLSTVRYSIAESKFWDPETNRFRWQPPTCPHIFVYSP